MTAFAGSTDPVTNVDPVTGNVAQRWPSGATTHENRDPYARVIGAVDNAAAYTPGDESPSADRVRRVFDAAQEHDTTRRTKRGVARLPGFTAPL